MPTAPPTIDALPDVPTRTNRAVFSVKMDNFLAAMPPYRVQSIALAANVYANAVEAAASAVTAASHASNGGANASAAAASASLAATQVALAIAALGNVNAAPNTWGTSMSNSGAGYTGVYYIITEAGKNWQTGNVVVFESRANPEAFVIGTVLAYAGTTLALTPMFHGVSGTYSDWVIYLLGAIPPLRSAGRQLRTNDAGTRMEWGDEGGRPKVLRSSQNLALYSKDFWVTGTWAQEGGSVGAVVTGPFGEQTGYPILATGPLPAYGRILQGGALPVASVPYTFSIYIKRGDVNYVSLDFITYGGGVPNGNGTLGIDLTSGCVVTSIGEDGPLECGSEFAGSGWWRVWIVVPARPGHNLWVAYLYGQGFGSTTGITHYSGAQLEIGRGPGPYVGTTTAPASGQGALRTNRLLHSMEVDTNVAGGWGLGVNATRVRKCVSPRGDRTATCYTTTSIGNAYIAQSGAMAANTQYTASVYARLVSGSVPTSGLLVGVNYDADGSPSVAEQVSIPFASSGLSSEWRRYSITFTNVAAITGTIFFAADFGNGAVIALWGAQLEIGPIATPFIPTDGAYLSGSSQTALLRRRHHLDTTNGPISIACDVPLQDGDWFEVEDTAGQCNANPITVMAGPVGRIAGDTADFVIDVPFWSGRFTYTKEKGLVIS